MAFDAHSGLRIGTTLDPPAATEAGPAFASSKEPFTDDEEGQA